MIFRFVVQSFLVYNKYRSTTKTMKKNYFGKWQKNLVTPFVWIYIYIYIIFALALVDESILSNRNLWGALATTRCLSKHQQQIADRQFCSRNPFCVHRRTSKLMCRTIFIVRTCNWNGKKKIKNKDLPNIDTLERYYFISNESYIYVIKPQPRSCGARRDAAVSRERSIGCRVAANRV